MNQLLKIDQTVYVEPGTLECTVEEFMGAGGQGEVYRARLGCDMVALKWYFPGSTRPPKDDVETLIRKGPPSSAFLWPEGIAISPEVKEFGYIMQLREPRYKGIVDLMKRRIEPSFRTLATAGYELAQSFHQLHSFGLCYRDISFGNVFLDPDTGAVRVCDNDNVTVNGDGKCNIRGTPRFMAPEIVCNKAQPSTQSDLFSLSVLLFYMFMMHHPLEGKKESAIKCLDLPAMERIYGHEPIFIFDPNDSSNRPDPLYHQNPERFWRIYPQFFKDLFIKAFTDGIRDPEHGRVRESEWRRALVQLRDSTHYCSNCGAENFYDGENETETERHTAKCWDCQRKTILPYRLVIGNKTLLLNHDTSLYPHHIDASRLYDFSEAVGRVTQHPRNASIWGIKNLSSIKWVVTSSDGNSLHVDHGRTFSLAKGTRIRFGTEHGVVQY